MIYLASPYSHDDPLVRQERYEAARDYIGNQIVVHKLSGFNRLPVIYSPIVHFHHIGIEHELPLDYQSWEYINDTMLGLASQLRILQIPGWLESEGIKHEMEFAMLHKIPMILV